MDYPIDQVEDPIQIWVMGREFHVQVQYHTVRNITFVLLDAVSIYLVKNIVSGFFISKLLTLSPFTNFVSQPVFRQQTKKDPYPARMDDLESAIYYAAWNSCIAETIRRFPSIDLYHINDYHGTLAPLYLLPRVIPVCLSLHNAEFQGTSASKPFKQQLS